jgi:hypothetical protein
LLIGPSLVPNVKEGDRGRNNTLSDAANATIDTDAYLGLQSQVNDLTTNVTRILEILQR